MLGKTNLPRNPGLRRRGSAVCVDDHQILMVRLKDPFTGEEFLSPPGGALEPKETPLAAGIRETLGYHQEILSAVLKLLEHVNEVLKETEGN